MYKTTLAVLICLLLISGGCAQITVKKDEINNKTLISLSMRNRATDYTLVNFTEVKFTREVSGQSYGPIQLYLSIYPVKKFQIFDNTVNFKIDDKVFKLAMKSIASDLLSNLIGTKNLSGVNIGINDRSTSSLSPTIKLSKEIEKEMMNAKTIMFSVSSGSEFALIKFNDNDIENIKKFITYKIE